MQTSIIGGNYEKLIIYQDNDIHIYNVTRRVCCYNYVVTLQGIM